MKKMGSYEQSPNGRELSKEYKKKRKAVKKAPNKIHSLIENM